MKLSLGEIALVIFLFIAGGVIAFGIGWLICDIYPLSKLIGG